MKKKFDMFKPNETTRWFIEFTTMSWLVWPPSIVCKQRLKQTFYSEADAKWASDYYRIIEQKENRVVKVTTTI